MATKPLYFDCDCGVDDAVALVYLAKSPEISLVGVGTVCGNIDSPQAAENSLRLLGLCGRSDVPVAIGENRFLTRDFTGGPVEIHGTNGIGGVELPAVDKKPVEKSAAQLLVELANEFPGELEICAVGPLTNLARAIALDPDLPDKVQQVTVMGGAFGVPGNVSPVAEANIWNDPEAAQIVVEQPWAISFVGLDVTMRSVLEESHRQQLLSSARPETRALGEMLDHYFDFYRAEYGRRCSPIHDAAAAVLAVGAAELMESPRVPIVIDTTDGPGRGQTIADLRGQRVQRTDRAGAKARPALEFDRDIVVQVMARLLP
ncbi:MAG: nucleoside hydrolase [Trueperella sp.]|nr:nucleoside hydrolase [Trueperella sp.]